MQSEFRSRGKSECEQVICRENCRKSNSVQFSLIAKVNRYLMYYMGNTHTFQEKFRFSSNFTSSLLHTLHLSTFLVKILQIKYLNSLSK